MTAEGEVPLSTAGSRFRADIQGLRAVAVALVVLNHVFAWPTGGYIGVDVFFVISGYLITGNLLRERASTGWISLKGFYARRIRRIVPVATVVAVVTVAAAYLLWFPPRANQAAIDGLASVLWVSNWHFAAIGTDYLAGTGAVSPFQHYWSLSVEEQFYIFWPWLLIGIAWAGARLFKLHDRRALLVGILGFALLSFCVAMLLTARSPTIAYFETVSRSWEFASGALLALVPRGALARFRSVAVLPGLGLVVIAAGALLLTSESPFPGPWALVPVLGAMLVIAGGERRQEWLLTNRTSVHLGEISYSLYLWHFPVVVFAHSVFPGAPLWLIPVELVVMWGLSALSYRFIELPARRSGWLRRWETDPPKSKRNELLAAAALATAVVALAALQVRGPAFLQDATPAAERAAMDQCRNSPGTTDPRFCEYGPADAEQTALVLGDSIAVSWIPAVASAYPDWRVTGVGFGNCSPFEIDTLPRKKWDNFVELCRSHKSFMFETAEAERPDLIFLSSDIGGYELMLDGSTGTDAEKRWTEAVARTVERYRELGSRVVVLASPPLGGDVRGCATRVTGYEHCTSRTSAEWRAKTRAEAAGTEASAGTFVDVGPWFCRPTGECPAVIDGMVARVDTGHTTDTFAATLGERLRSAVR